MRCLVTGAYGFIGQHVVRALLEAGCEVIGAGRDLALGRRLLPGIDWIGCDFNHDLTPEVWAPRLAGIDAVVNCVGILQSSARDSTERVHLQGSVALFRAVAEAKVSRLVHISAISADASVGTGYSRSKLAAERALGALDVNWLIVKPSLVVGPGSYGGTSLLRGLAGLPGILPVPDVGEARFEPVAMGDLALGVAHLAAKTEPSRTTLYATGPEPLGVDEIVREFRAWLGFRPAPVLHVPAWLLRPVLLAGDLAGWLGHPSAMRTTSLRQMRYDRLHDPVPFAKAAEIKLTPLKAALAETPAALQDRLHARTYFLLPLLQIAIALFWIATGAVTLMPSGFDAARALLSAGPVPTALAGPVVAAAALADIALGVLFLLPGWVRRAGAAQIAFSIGYLAALGWLRPSLWLAPLGPLLKVVPLIFATMVVMAAAEKR